MWPPNCLHNCRTMCSTCLRRHPILGRPYMSVFRPFLRPSLHQAQQFMRDVSTNVRHCTVPRRTKSFSSVTIPCSPCCARRKNCGCRCLALCLSLSLSLSVAVSLSELVAAFRVQLSLLIFADLRAGRPVSLDWRCPLRRLQMQSSDLVRRRPAALPIHFLVCWNGTRDAAVCRQCTSSHPPCLLAPCSRPRTAFKYWQSAFAVGVARLADRSDSSPQATGRSFRVAAISTCNAPEQNFESTPMTRVPALLCSNPSLHRAQPGCQHTDTYKSFPATRVRLCARYPPSLCTPQLSLLVSRMLDPALCRANRLEDCLLARQQHVITLVFLDRFGDGAVRSPLLIVNA